MYNCRCKCQNFREHAMGVSFAQSSMPSRSNITARKAEDKQHDKDFAAFERLDAAGYTPQQTRGSAELEARATTEVELKHGRLYNDAKAMQTVYKEETS